MNYLGIDYGEKRIGLSYSDELRVALPLPPSLHKTLKDHLEVIAQVIKAKKIDALVVGYPYNMDGSIGFKAKEVDIFIETLKKQFNLPVYTTDERLTSHQAQSDMISIGLTPKKQSIKARQNARKTGDVDSRAAALILQDFLEANQDK